MSRPVWRITSSEYTVLVMAVDILELAEFYAGLDGARARVQIVEKIDALWPDPQAEPVLGFGYVLPYAYRLLWRHCAFQSLDQNISSNSYTLDALWKTKYRANIYRFNACGYVPADLSICTEYKEKSSMLYHRMLW